MRGLGDHEGSSAQRAGSGSGTVRPPGMVGHARATPQQADHEPRAAAGDRRVGVCVVVGPARAHQGECPWYIAGPPGHRGVLRGRTCPGPPGQPGGAPWALGGPGHTHRSESGGAVSSAGARATAGGTKKEGRPKPPPLPRMAVHSVDLLDPLSVPTAVRPL